MWDLLQFNRGIKFLLQTDAKIHKEKQFRISFGEPYIGTTCSVFHEQYIGQIKKQPTSENGTTEIQDKSSKMKNTQKNSIQPTY